MPTAEHVIGNLVLQIAALQEQNQALLKELDRRAAIETSPDAPAPAVSAS
jgi:hypothetical protein